ncbi:MAG TPA: PH domain-containing protein [Chitinophagaceae bacterium]
MQFQNLQVNWENIPKSGSAELKPIEKEYLKVLYISWGILYAILFMAVIAVLLLVGDVDTSWWILTMAGIAAVAIVNFIIGTGSFRRKGFAVREKDILYRTGWIFQKLHIVPFNRVQHCVVQSGPIGRRFGLASLSIYTAASNINDIAIHGLKNEDAESLKAWILEQIQPLN